jgi:hypothetical protein
MVRTALDSMRVTQRVLNLNLPGVVTIRHVFFHQPVADCTARIQAAKEELQRLVVLALTAIFERTLRDYLVQMSLTALPPGDPHGDAVRAEIVKDIEFWNISARVMDVFPGVDPAVRGDVKQIIDYRNWVAHGHTLARPAPARVVPVKAHQVLTAFLVQAGVITPSGFEPGWCPRPHFQGVRRLA